MQKVFCVDTLINLNTNISNNLEFDFNLHKINLEPRDNSVQIECPLNSVISRGFSIRKDSDFLIPFKIKVNSGFSNCLGKFNLLWQDETIKSFDPNLFNKFEFSLPDLHVKPFDISLSYEIPKSICDKTETQMKILIKNISDEYKRLVFLIDTSSQFVMSGSVNKKLLLSPAELKTLTLAMIPANFGKLKLPLFKVMVYPLASTNYENKIYSIYKIPEFLQVSESN